MPVTMFEPKLMNLLKKNEKVSGLIVYKVEETPEHFSHERVCPNRNSGSNS